MIFHHKIQGRIISFIQTLTVSISVVEFHLVHFFAWVWSTVQSPNTTTTSNQKALLNMEDMRKTTLKAQPYNRPLSRCVWGQASAWSHCILALLSLAGICVEGCAVCLFEAQWLCVFERRLVINNFFFLSVSSFHPFPHWWGNRYNESYWNDSCDPQGWTESSFWKCFVQFVRKVITMAHSNTMCKDMTASIVHLDRSHCSCLSVCWQKWMFPKY